MKVTKKYLNRCKHCNELCKGTCQGAKDARNYVAEKKTKEMEERQARKQFSFSSEKIQEMQKSLYN